MTMKVTYSGEVEWRSPGGSLIRFEDSGSISVTGTTTTISPLIPGTRYQFKVSAITSRGNGAEVSAFETIRRAQDGTLCISSCKHYN